MNNLKTKIYKILDKEFDSSCIATIGYTDKNLIATQKKQGMNVVVPTEDFTRYIKCVYGACGADYIECILVAKKPNEYLTKVLNQIYWTSANKNNNKVYKNIYYKENNQWVKFIADPQDSKLDKIKEDKMSAQVAIDRHTEELYKGQRIPEDRKAKMRKYIRYYDLDMPKTEPEWVEVYHQLAYYIRNKIDYAFDTNQYTVCEECGELVRRGTEHICYCELPEKRTKLDILVNGGV